MEKLIRWWKKEGTYSSEKRYVTLVKSLLFLLLPVMCCLIMWGGRGSAESYLTSSEWNDELFYYKQVEGILRFGYPQGYFGYNESHALKLSFGAWSPVLVFPWVLWGLVFGWNLMSPILCNIVLMTLCCFLFVWLVRPSWKQLGILAVLFYLFNVFARYMLSGMPEIICFSMLITFYALTVNYLRRERVYKLVLLFMLSGVMTLMRPYMLLFLLLPAYLWIRRDSGHAFRWVGVAGSIALFGSVLGLYAYINYYFGAKYFKPLFFTDWITAYFERGIAGGIRHTAGILYYQGSDLLRDMVQGIRTGLATGVFFAGYLICMCVLVIQSFLDWRKWKRLSKEQGIADEERKTIENQLVVEVHLALSFVAMLFAILLMYELTDGSKHLLTFMAAAVFIIAIMKTKYYKKAVIVGITFAYFHSYLVVDFYDYKLPFTQEERVASVKAFEESLAGKLTLERDNAPSYDNVVIWVFGDRVDGAGKNTTWQLLYGLPAGFGISCCMRDYVLENFGDLKSRYLLTPAGGEIDALCREAGYKLLYEDGETVFYERKPIFDNREN